MRRGIDETQIIVFPKTHGGQIRRWIQWMSTRAIESIEIFVSLGIHYRPYGYCEFT